MALEGNPELGCKTRLGKASALDVDSDPTLEESSKFARTRRSDI